MAVSILALAALGCGGGGGTPTAAPTQGAVAIQCNTGSGGQAATIADFAYQPDPAAVAAGGTITWTNQDGVGHTVSFDDGPDCGNIAGGGASQTVQFNVAGTYPYHCNIHPSMTGTVTVN